MSPKAKNRASFLRRRLCNFLVQTGNSRDLAHFFVETLGEEGFEILRKRMIALKDDQPGRDQDLATLLGVTELSQEEQRALEIT